MSTAPATANTGTQEWTAIPAPPKVPNFHQGYGYTLHYGSPGWDVHEGTHDTKTTLGEVLFHAKTAKEAKEWAAKAGPAKPAAKPAAKPRAPRAAKGDAAKAAKQPEPAKADDTTDA